MIVSDGGQEFQDSVDSLSQLDEYSSLVSGLLIDQVESFAAEKGISSDLILGGDRDTCIELADPVEVMDFSILNPLSQGVFSLSNLNLAEGQINDEQFPINGSRSHIPIVPGTGRHYSLTGDLTYYGLPFESITGTFKTIFGEVNGPIRNWSPNKPQPAYRFMTATDQRVGKDLKFKDFLTSVRPNEQVTEFEVPVTADLRDINNLQKLLDSISLPEAEKLLYRSLFFEGIDPSHRNRITKENSTVKPYPAQFALEYLAREKTAYGKFLGSIDNQRLRILDLETYLSELPMDQVEVIKQAFGDHRPLLLEAVAETNSNGKPFGFVKQIGILGWRKDLHRGKYYLELRLLESDRSTLDQNLADSRGVAYRNQYISVKYPFQGGSPGLGKRS